MKLLKQLLITILIVVSLVQCTGTNNLNSDFQITEAGNPPNKPKKLRSITGFFASPNEPTSICAATGIRATDSAGQIKEANITNECRFSLDLATDKVWDLKILYNSNVTAKATFESLPNQVSSYYFLSDSSEVLNFGYIHLAGNKAFPEFEATKQNDADGDSSSDYEDLDDDNDSILDTDETDCDFDGIIDDYDESSNC